ncbi:MAG: outer membrane protein assembly factor BamE [Candidatus Pseudothioglobus sp.]|jgi:outer membrane protein assembly factor BamE|nr:outer membrane protein assembly factor BamE [Candidatus Thioglobus sp.]MDC0195404.1 outer membrane protein assembly factor BamE [Candidatus Thioglobus sp.]|tara:strand:- start:130 stop:573 length:444 start_codon:yes stop_codon:yes gene_type:complete
MNRLTFILIATMALAGCSNSLPKVPELPKMPEFSMPELPKMPKLSLPSWAKPKLPSIDVYKPTILQGSVLEMSDVNLLQVGMTKDMVMNLIGSPSIIDPFHQYQWDYINHSSIEGETKIQYRLRLIFDGNILDEIDKTGLEGLLSSD